MGSPKQQALDRKIMHLLSGTSLQAAQWLMQDKEIQHLQDYANTVSIKRLHYNDHGQVHMRKVALNALLLAELLHQADIVFNLEAENMGTYAESQTAILTASFLHDVGMAIGRENHEHTGVLMALPIIERLLNTLYETDLEKKVIMRALIMECMVGHMGTQKIYSIEAGVILIADGCDMEQGRARIPLMLETESKVGDIHKYSSSAVQSVEIEKGGKKPTRITVNMTESVGFFQVEEVLFKKINSSPIRAYIELYAGVIGQKMKCYL
ncbi:MAG: phosphohydrolase [Desulfobacteraceae bacterium]|nr:MAG: phosphohydrolase [Desulfobacteraceae bacterium]